MDQRTVFECIGKNRGRLYSDGSGYFYRVKSYGEKNWLLSCRFKVCRGTANLINPNSVDRTIKHGAIHSCEPNKRIPETFELRQKILQRCAKEETSLKKIFIEETKKSDPEVASLLKYESLETSMFRARNKDWCLPIPQNIDEFITSLQDNSERFNEIFGATFLSGVVEDEEDVGVIFVVQHLETVLTESTELHLDATCRCPKTKPDLKRLFNIMALHEGYAIPVVFCLLTKVTANIYKKIFSHLKEKYPDLSPDLIVGGYEPELEQAVLASFPSSRYAGSQFHYTQSILRKLQKLGLEELFKMNTFLNKATHMLIALPLLPHDKIEEGMNVVETYFRSQPTQTIATSHKVKIWELFWYVKSHWIGQVGSKCFSVNGQIERTRNCQQRLLHRINTLIGAYQQPNIWTIQRTIISVARQSVNDFMHFIQMDDDEIARRTRKKTLLIDEKLMKMAEKKLMADPPLLTVSQFLLAVAYKCSNLLPKEYSSDEEEEKLEKGGEEENEGDEEEVGEEENEGEEDYDCDMLFVVTSTSGDAQDVEIVDQHLEPLQSSCQKRGLMNDDSPENKRIHRDSLHQDDASEAFARNVASKLRGMNKIQRLAAEKIINETLLYGELEKLSLPFATQFGASIENFNTRGVVLDQ